MTFRFNRLFLLVIYAEESCQHFGIMLEPHCNREDDRVAEAVRQLLAQSLCGWVSNIIVRVGT